MSWFANKGQVLQLGATVTFGLFGGATVLAALTGMAQKFMGLPLDWWILLLVFAGGLLLMWWSHTALKNRSSEPEAKVSTPPLQLQPNQIIYPSYPSKNGVLWEWSPGGLSGPFCPTHRVRLFLWPTYGAKKAEFVENDILSSNASFVCPLDEEEFIFIRPGPMKVGALRAQALEQFEVERERRKLLEK